MTRSLKPFVFSNRPDCDPDIDVKNLGLYFHIPFCKKICNFCPYYRVRYDKALLEGFNRALFTELDLVAEASGSKKEITSIYFGGGSPALIADHLSGLMDRISRSFSFRGHAGIELHPRDVNKDSLKKIRDAGFDMVSIGIQSFQDSCLKSLGRKEKINGVKRL